MVESKVLRWLLAVAALGLFLGPVVTWWLPTRGGDDLQPPTTMLARLALLPPEESSPLLTDLLDHLARSHPVRQVLILQAVPDEPPQIVATIEDSSDDEQPTHWPSPWSAVNEALRTGTLPAPLSVNGHHAGFDYRHTLIPLDETRSRVLLINQSTLAPKWGLSRLALTSAGALLLIWLAVDNRGRR